MASILDLMNSIESAGDRGRQRGQQSRLATLYSGALQAPQDQRGGYLAEIAKVSPDAAFNAEQHFTKMDSSGRERLGQYAAAFSALPDDQKPQAYPQLARQAQALGIPAPTEWRPEFGPNIQQLAQALNSGGAGGVPAELQAFNAYSQGLPADDVARARRIQLGLDPRASSAAIGYKLVKGADGVERLVALDPREVGAQVIGSGQSYGSGVQAPAAPGLSGQQLFASIEDVIQPLGGRITSTTGGQHNVGSLHPDGRAVDVGMGQESPERQAQIMSALQSAGYKVVDERTRPAGQEVWSGPHLHVEAPGGGANPFESRTPEAEAAAVETAKGRASLGLLPEQGRIEAQNAAAKTRAEAAAQQDTAAGIEAQKQFGKDAAGRFETIQQKAQLARTENGRLLELRSHLKNAYTGPGANAVLGAKRAASAMGMKVEGLGDAEAARALSNQLALGLRNPAGGEGMPGAMSDADRVFLQQSVPGLQSTPAGWRALIDMRVALNDAAIKQARYAEQLRRDGTPVQDIPGLLQEFADQNQIFKVGGTASAPAQAQGGILRYNPETGDFE